MVLETMIQEAVAIINKYLPGIHFIREEHGLKNYSRVNQEKQSPNR